MIARREFLVAVAGLTVVGACGPAGPGSVTIVAQGTAGMNPGAGGADLPLTVQIVQMRGSGAFDNADFFALQDPASALGGDFVSAQALAIAPGGKATATIAVDAATSLIGVVAGFHNPNNKVFRAKSAPPKSGDATFRLDITGSGITLVPA